MMMNFVDLQIEACLLETNWSECRSVFHGLYKSALKLQNKFAYILFVGIKLSIF